MIPDDIQALALADAIGALDPDERRDLEARLAALPPSVRAEVAHLYDASVEIAASASGEEPSPGVRDALLARVAAPSNHTITSTDGEWVETAMPGVRMKILAIDRARDRVTMLLKGEPGARYPAHRHSGPEECYVISGSLIVEGRSCGRATSTTPKARAITARRGPTKAWRCCSSPRRATISDNHSSPSTHALWPRGSTWISRRLFIALRHSS